MPNQPKYKPSHVVINPELKKEAKEVAASQGKNFSEVVEEALNEWLNRQ